MIKVAPVKCNHCKEYKFLVFNYLDTALVLQCDKCKMIYIHQDGTLIEGESHESES